MNFNKIKEAILSRKLKTRTECIKGVLSVTGYDADMNLIVVVNKNLVQVKGKVYPAGSNLELALNHYKSRGAR